MPEASGGYAMLVNPYSVDDIVDAIRELDKGSVLLDNLLNNGYINAKKYTWDKSADELYDVLKNIVSFMFFDYEKIYSFFIEFT